MSKTLQVGHHYVASAVSSDPTQPLPLGSVVATSSLPSAVSAVADSDNNVTITALLPNSSVAITVSAPGYMSAQEGVVVPQLPSIILNDGPIV